MICQHLNPLSVICTYIFLWMLRQAGGHLHQDFMAKTLAPPRLSHIVSKNNESWRVSSWRICSQPQTRSIVRMTVPHESQQIDYSFSSDTCLRSRKFDSSATSSDHWGLIAAIKSNRVRIHRKKIARKPIGWECRDRIGYNNEVRAYLNVDER